VLTGISGKSGHPVSFMRFTKYGFPIMIETIILSSIYLLIRYYPSMLGLGIR
jgi:Na+/H+ antiporter NhaD/arsenite permease-like protein